MFKMYRERIKNSFLKIRFLKTITFQNGLKHSMKINHSFIYKQLRGFASGSESGNYNTKVDVIDKQHIIDINPTNLKIKIPFHCSVFQLSQILNVDMIALVNKYKETINIEINDPMEYLPSDDLELFLLENGIDFEIEEHHKNIIKRPMVVTIMGHVDHGKTTLLDTFRNSKKVDQEFGKITQSIGAFNITLKDYTKLTFIDTPGHEAFAKMRQRGAKVTDCIILVISGIESIQKQTIEVINIIKSVKVPFIVAVNKIDKDQADPVRVYRDLEEYGIKVKQIGGKIPTVEISAKNKINMDLLEKELSNISKSLNLEEDVNISSQAFIIESQTTKIQSYVNPSASAIVKKGILKEGDIFICGDSYGKVKLMMDDMGNIIKEAIPGEAVEIIGFKTTPQTGNVLAVMNNINLVEKLIEDKMKLKEYNEAMQKESLNKGIKLGKIKSRKERNLYRFNDKEYMKKKLQSVMDSQSLNNAEENSLKELYLKEYFLKKKKIILRADTKGMLETIEDEILRNFDKNKLDEFIIQTGVGLITEEDFRIAQSANAVFFTFNIDQEIEGFSDIYYVGVRKHKLIYNIIEEIKHFIEEADLIDPEYSTERESNIKGRAIVKEVYKIKINNKHTQIAGCEIEQGNINPHYKFRIIRDKKVEKLNMKVSSLKQNKINVSMVREGEECGIIFENYDDIVKGDIIDCYEINQKFEGITDTKGVVVCY